MAVCTGGSRPKPTASAFVHVDPTFAASLLPAGLLWLVPFLSYLPPMDVDLSNVCTADPVELPTLDAQDLRDVLTGTPVGGAFIGGFKAAQVVHHYLWYAFCECVGATPPPPPGQVEPTGAPRLNPTGFVTVPNTPGPCGADYSGHYGTPSAPSVGTFTYGAVTYPSDRVRTVRVKYNHVSQGATHPLLTTRLAWTSGVSQVGTSASWTIPPGQASQFDLPLPAFSTTRVSVEVTTPSTSTDLIGVSLELLCDVNPGGGALADCGPDTRTIGLLEQIYKLLLLVQRYHVPFDFVVGASHSGAAGRGSFAISRLVGMKVTITSHDTTKPDLEGNPPYVWDQGWMSVSTPDGMIEEKRISQTTLTWLPRLMDLATVFGFELRPGTIATFTELQAET